MAEVIRYFLAARYKQMSERDAAEKKAKEVRDNNARILVGMKRNR